MRGPRRTTDIPLTAYRWGTIGETGQSKASKKYRPYINGKKLARKKGAPAAHLHVPDSGHSTHRTPLPCTPGTSDTRSRSSLPAAAHHRAPCPAVSAKIGEGYVQKKGLGAKGAATSPVTKTITKKAPATPATPKKAPAKKAAGSYLFQGTAPSKSGGKFWRVRREGTLLNACCLLVPPTPPCLPFSPRRSRWLGRSLPRSTVRLGRKRLGFGARPRSLRPLQCAPHTRLNFNTSTHVTHWILPLP